MRRALVHVLLALVLASVAGAAPAADAVIGYDHVLHDGYVEAKGRDAPDCGRCHTLDRRLRPAKPGHGACFGSGCHVYPKPGAAPEPKTLCLACHETARPAGRARATWAGDASRDFGLTFPHDRHATSARCVDCHRAPTGATRAAAAVPGPPAHDRCSGCHGATPAPDATPPPFAIASCDRCHRAIAGRFERPSQVQSPYGVGAAFSHDAHLPRTPGTPAARCVFCHAEVQTTSGVAVPAPTMASCEACHDGTRAFAALGNTCRRCHTTGQALPAAEPPRLFEHRQHIAAGAPARCDACHALDDRGVPRPVGHAACASATCHASDFRSRTPRLCGGCHVGTEPWRPLRADAPRRARSEFGAEFSHGAHLAERAGTGPRSPQACADCHTGAKGGVPMRLGRGHASCAGASCHTTAAPRLADCSGCHALGLLPARDARRASSRWSTAARFDHAAHERDRLDQPVRCVACHTGVLEARRIAEIPVPRKPACAACHDGVLGFKMTGHACGRCHGHPRGGLPGR